MKFYAPGLDPVMIALTSGHTTVVDPEGTEMEPRFHKEALAQGCRPEGAAADEGFDRTQVFDRKKVIKAAIETLLDSNEPDAFTGDGVPALRKVTEAAGFAVSREERDAVWAEVSAE
jgi:hypothetical protein